MSLAQEQHISNELLKIDLSFANPCFKDEKWLFGKAEERKSVAGSDLNGGSIKPHYNKLMMIRDAQSD